MAANKRLPQQVVKVKNYGDVSINNLALALTIFEKMDSKDRSAVLKFMKSKYSAEWPSDNY